MSSTRPLTRDQVEEEVRRRMIPAPSPPWWTRLAPPPPTTTPSTSVAASATAAPFTLSAEDWKQITATIQKEVKSAVAKQVGSATAAIRPGLAAPTTDELVEAVQDQLATPAFYQKLAAALHSDPQATQQLLVAVKELLKEPSKLKAMERGMLDELDKAMKLQMVLYWSTDEGKQAQQEWIDEVNRTFGAHLTDRLQKELSKEDKASIDQTVNAKLSQAVTTRLALPLEADDANKIARAVSTRVEDAWTRDLTEKETKELDEWAKGKRDERIRTQLVDKDTEAKIQAWVTDTLQPALHTKADTELANYTSSKPWADRIALWQSETLTPLLAKIVEDALQEDNKGGGLANSVRRVRPTLRKETKDAIDVVVKGFVDDVLRKEDAKNMVTPLIQEQVDAIQAKVAAEVTTMVKDVSDPHFARERARLIAKPPIPAELKLDPNEDATLKGAITQAVADAIEKDARWSTTVTEEMKQLAGQQVVDVLQTGTAIGLPGDVKQKLIEFVKEPSTLEKWVQQAGEEVARDEGKANFGELLAARAQQTQAGFLRRWWLTRANEQVAAEVKTFLETTPPGSERSRLEKALSDYLQKHPLPVQPLQEEPEQRQESAKEAEEEESVKFDRFESEAKVEPQVIKWRRDYSSVADQVDTDKYRTVIEDAFRLLWVIVYSTATAAKKLEWLHVVVGKVPLASWLSTISWVDRLADRWIQYELLFHFFEAWGDEVQNPSTTYDNIAVLTGLLEIQTVQDLHTLTWSGLLWVIVHLPDESARGFFLREAVSHLFAAPAEGAPSMDNEDRFALLRMKHYAQIPALLKEQWGAAVRDMRALLTAHGLWDDDTVAAVLNHRETFAKPKDSRFALWQSVTYRALKAPEPVKMLDNPAFLRKLVYMFDPSFTEMDAFLQDAQTYTDRPLASEHSPLTSAATALFEEWVKEAYLQEDIVQRAQTFVLHHRIPTSVLQTMQWRDPQLKASVIVPEIVHIHETEGMVTMHRTDL